MTKTTRFHDLTVRAAHFVDAPLQFLLAIAVAVNWMVTVMLLVVAGYLLGVANEGERFTQTDWERESTAIKAELDGFASAHGILHHQIGFCMDHVNNADQDGREKLNP